MKKIISNYLLDKYTVKELEFLVKIKEIEIKKTKLNIAKKNIIRQKLNLVNQ